MKKILKALLVVVLIVGLIAFYTPFVKLFAEQNIIEMGMGTRDGKSVMIYKDKSTNTCFYYEESSETESPAPVETGAPTPSDPTETPKPTPMPPETPKPTPTPTPSESPKPAETIKPNVGVVAPIEIDEDLDEDEDEEDATTNNDSNLLSKLNSVVSFFMTPFAKIVQTAKAEQNSNVSGNKRIRKQTSCRLDLSNTDHELSHKNRTPNIDIVIVSFFTGNEVSYPSKVLIGGGRLDQLPVLNNEDGKEFLGWYVDSEFKTKFDLSKPIIQSMTLYAKWEDKSGNQDQTTEPRAVPNTADCE